MSDLLKILLLLAISSVKFVAGPPFAYFHNQYDYTFLETNVFCITGGMMGVFIVIYVSEFIMKGWKLFKRKLNLQFKSEKKEKKIFSKRNRRIVRIWKQYGLLGISFLTPVLFSIPVGTFIATRLATRSRNKILFYMFLSISFWSVVLTGMFEIYNVVSVNELSKVMVK